MSLVEELGKANLKPLTPVASDTIATICYTSVSAMSILYDMNWN